MMRLKNTKKVLLALSAVAIVSIGISFAHPVYAQEWVAKTFGPILLNVVFFPFITLLNKLTFALVEVAKYNTFADAPIVDKGWPIIRNISNMFFVLILLIIAIGTIVKWEKVNYRQNLRRLIIMALLINFSKTIVVFFIDVSQIFTLTFITEVNKVLQVGIITALGLDKIANPVTQGALQTTEQASINLFTYIMAGAMVAVACLAVAVILLIFLVRILALWMLIIFAPLAFISSALPQTREWYDRWWKQLGSNVTSAPVLAFMLWLVFAVIADNSGKVPEIVAQGGTGSGVDASDIIGFAVGIGLLIYSIRMAVSMGAAGGSLASKLQSRVTGVAKSVGNRVAWGKSGQGGALGRAKSVGLRVGGATAAGAAFLRVPLAGRLAESATIAHTKQMNARDAAEEERRKYMTRPQREAQLERSIGPRFIADALEKRGGILGRVGGALKTASAPQRRAAIMERAKRGHYTEKDETDQFIVSEKEASLDRQHLVASGASEKQLEEYDKSVGLRGLNAQRNAQGDFVDKFEGERHQRLMKEMFDEGKLNNDIKARDTDYASKLIGKQTENKIVEFTENVQGAAKDRIVDNLVAQLRTVNANIAAAGPGRASADDLKNKKKLDNAISRIDYKRAMASGFIDMNTIANKIEDDKLNDFYDEVSRVDASTGKADQTHELSTSNMSRILTSSKVLDNQKETLMDNMMKLANDPSDAIRQAAAQKKFNELRKGTSTAKIVTEHVDTRLAVPTPNPDVVAWQTWEDSHDQAQAKKLSTKQLTEAKGRMDKFKPDQNVRHFDKNGKLQENWSYESFDPISGMIKIRMDKKDKSGKIIAKGTPIEVPLAEFTQRNYV